MYNNLILWRKYGTHPIISWNLNANKIYVIESGKILEHGTHDDLLKNSQTYKNFYEKQLRKD